MAHLELGHIWLPQHPDDPILHCNAKWGQKSQMFFAAMQDFYFGILIDDLSLDPGTNKPGTLTAMPSVQLVGTFCDIILLADGPSL